MATAKQKDAGRQMYQWSPGPLNIRKASQRVGFQLPFDIVTLGNIEAIIAELGKATYCALDTETTSLDPDVAKLCCVSFCWGDKAYVAYAHHSNEKAVLPREAFVALMWAIYSVGSARVGEMLPNGKPRTLAPVVFFNFNYDYRIIRNTIPEIPWRSLGNRIVDTQGLVFLSDTNIFNWSLKSASRYFLGVDPPEFDQEALGEAIFTQNLYQLTFYAAFDAWDTAKLYELFLPEIKRLMPFILNVDSRLQIPLVEFEENELPIDWELVREYSQLLSKKIEITKSEFFGKYGVINLNSGDQKAEVLRRLGYDTKEKTDTGKMKVDIKNLEKLKEQGCDAAALMVNYSKLVKLQSSYVSPMVERMEHGLPVRFKYRHYRVPTYRLAAGSYSPGKKVKKALKNLGYWTSVNVQSAPKPKIAERRTNFDPQTFSFDFASDGKYVAETGSAELTFRKAFIAPDSDWVWVSSDFSSQELVIISVLSKDPTWLEALRNGEDLHKKMALGIWGPENYDKNKRKIAKSINFGVAYGAEAPTLARSANIPVPQAAEILANTKKFVPRLFQWFDEVHQEGRRNGFIVNPFGLIRQVAPYYRMGKSWAAFGDRTTVNTKIQSSGSVMIRIALYKLWELLELEKYKGKVRFMVTVHDEVNLVVHKSVLLDFLGDLDFVLRAANHPSWEVKVSPEHSIGANWAEVVAVELIKDANGKVVALKPKAELAGADTKPAEAPGGEAEDFLDLDQFEYGEQE